MGTREGAVKGWRKRPRPLLERFMSHVQKTETCWLWTGKKSKQGYGDLACFGTGMIASRLSYELLVGRIPRYIQVNHTCNNPPCVNPDHLYLGTQKENVHDAIRSGRWVPGAKVGHFVSDETRRKISESHIGRRWHVENGKRVYT